MKWVQWLGTLRPGKIHTTFDSRRTFCECLIPTTDLLYNESVRPEDCKDLCQNCQKIEAQVRPFERLRR